MTDGEERPTLHLIVGPNGAGKTTFYDLQLRPLTDAEFFNADRLQADQPNAAADREARAHAEQLKHQRELLLIEAQHQRERERDARAWSSQPTVAVVP